MRGVERRLKKDMPRVWAKIVGDDRWEVDPHHMGSGHVRLRFSDGRWVTAPCSTSDWRSQFNVVARMKAIEQGRPARGIH